MKKLGYLIVFFIVFSLLIACSTSQEVNDLVKEEEVLVENHLVKVGIMDEYSPYIVNESGQVSGPYLDIVVQVLESLDYEYEVVVLPWSRLLNAVKLGEVDIALPFFYNEEREAFLVYADSGIGFSQLDFISLEDKKVDYYGDFSDLSDYSVGIVQDYFYSSEVSAAIEDGTLTVDQANSADENIEKLLQGRVDLIIEDYAVVKEYLGSKNLEDNMHYYQPPVTNDFNYLVFNKSDDLVQLIDQVNAELMAMKSDGRLKAIYAAYDMTYYSDMFKELEEEVAFFEALGTLRIGILGETKPYAYFENEELKGFGIEYMATALDRIGVDYEFVDVPFARMLQELEKGSLDIGTDLYFKEERSEYAYYPKLPYAAYPTVLFKKTSMDFEYTGDVESLKDYRIGYIRDYYLGVLEAFKDHEDFNFIVTQTPEQNMENLKNERVDLIIDIQSTGENMAKEMNFDDNIEVLLPPVHYDYSYNVFSKKNNMSPLVKAYEMVVDEMHHDGTVQALAKKYGLPYLEFNEFK